MLCTAASRVPICLHTAWRDEVRGNDSICPLSNSEKGYVRRADGRAESYPPKYQGLVRNGLSRIHNSENDLLITCCANCDKNERSKAVCVNSAILGVGLFDANKKTLFKLK
jgi:hypothetical protein